MSFDHETTPNNDEPSTPEPRRRPDARRASLKPLHVDDDVLVFNKPAGFPVTVRADGDVTLPRFAGPAFGEIGRLFSVVPLDDDAGGVILLARTADARDRLLDQLAERTLDACYLVLVRALPMEEAGAIDRPIGLSRRGGRPWIDVEAGRPAVTDWRLRDRFVGFALLECHLRTPVPHQLRLHLADAGMPPAVDPVHGLADRLMLSSFKVGYRLSRRRPERPLIDRLSLLAASISFRHPRTGAPMRYEAPLPKDLRAALHQLDRFGRLPPPTR